MDSDEQDVSNDQMEVQKVTIPFKNIEIKQPKIMVAIYEEGKVRENSSPMRGNRMKAGAVCNQRTILETSSKVPQCVHTPGSKAIVDTPPFAQSKISPDLAKRIEGLNPLKHQLPAVDSSPNTKPRHGGIPPFVPTRYNTEDGLPAKPILKTPPILIRRPSFTDQRKQTGFDTPGLVSNNLNFGTGNTTRDHEREEP